MTDTERGRVKVTVSEVVTVVVSVTVLVTVQVTVKVPVLEMVSGVGMVPETVKVTGKVSVSDNFEFQYFIKGLLL